MVNRNQLQATAHLEGPMEDVHASRLSYPSADGASRINAKIWTSGEFGERAGEGAVPRSIVQIVHGMAEHIDRYDSLAEHLVGRGFVVCAEDHIGHGGTAASPEDFGHMPVHGGKDILISDVETLRRIMAERFPGAPHVMYGHSMGSFIVRAHLARHGRGLAAAILSGTGTLPPALSALGRTMATALATIRGPRHRSKFIDSLGAGGYGAQIDGARTPLDWLSTDDAVVDAYIADERCGFMFTVGGYATLLDLTGEIADPKAVASVPSDVPVLLIAGEEDPVGSRGEGVRAAAELLEGAGVEDVTVILYPGMRHEIHNEIGKERVLDDLDRWLDERLDAGQR